MYVCPECGKEYPKAGKCKDCGAALVEQESEGSEDTEEEWDEESSEE